MTSSRFVCLFIAFSLCSSVYIVLGEKYNFISNCIWKGGATESLTFFCGEQFVPDRFFNYDHAKKPCVNNRDGYIKNDIVEISFENCTFAKIPHDIIEFYRFIQKLDISNLGLKILIKSNFNGAHQQRLRALVASHNLLTEIEEGLFDDATHIHDVDFSYNQIKRIDPSAFVNATELLSLDLSNNNLLTIDNQAIRKLENLQNLYVRNNKISAIDALTFDGLKLLSKLDLSQNSLKKVNPNAFRHFPSLFYLNLSANAISELDAQFFNYIEQIRILDLSHNNISNFGNSFGSNVALTDLYISNNHIKSINQLASANFADFRMLDVSNNQITGLCDHIFDKFPNLIDVNLAMNPIKKLNETIFINNANLRRLNLSQMGLETIGIKTFLKAHKLEMLDLSMNQLKRLDSNMFLPSFTDLKMFYIEGNKIDDLYGFRKQLFPNLRTLGIQNNNFNCSYLHNFFDKIVWHDLFIDIDRIYAFTIDEDNVNGIRCRKITETSDSSEIGNEYDFQEDRVYEVAPAHIEMTPGRGDKGYRRKSTSGNGGGHFILIFALCIIALAVFGGFMYKEQIMKFVETKRIMYGQNNYSRNYADTEPVVV